MAAAMKLIGSKAIAAPRRIAAVPLNSVPFLSIQPPAPANDHVKRASKDGMMV
jgi:hypothetical protein